MLQLEPGQLKIDTFTLKKKTVYFKPCILFSQNCVFADSGYLRDFLNVCLKKEK